MNKTIIIDGRPLTRDELAYHKGFVNAALCGILSSGVGMESAVAWAFLAAEKGIEQLRAISVDASPEPGRIGSKTPFVLAPEEGIIEAWMESTAFTQSHNQVITALREPENDVPLRLNQIVHRAKVGADVVEGMVRDGYLVPAGGNS